MNGQSRGQEVRTPTVGKIWYGYLLESNPTGEIGRVDINLGESILEYCIK